MEKSVRNKIIAIHAAFWVYEFTFGLLWGDSLSTLVWVYALFIPTVYLHYFVLIPRIIKEPTVLSFLKWYGVFFAIILVRKQIDFFVGVEYFDSWGWIDLKGTYSFYDRFKKAILITVSNSSGILAITLGSRYVINKAKAEKLQIEKDKNELAALKNQVDIPESINILKKLEQKAEANPESIQDDIIQLSTVLRYHLYSKGEKVFLSNELEIVKHQLQLYNELNQANLNISSNLKDRQIKMGGLSKLVGEVLKHSLKVKSEFELMGVNQNTFLKISDSDLDYLTDLKNRLLSKFECQFNIQTSNKAIIIQLN